MNGKQGHTRSRTRSLRSLFSFMDKPQYRATSPTFTDISATNFRGENAPAKIITRANLKSSMLAYEELMDMSATYRDALTTMAKATAAFADALEQCSGLKGPTYESGTRMQAASGLHHLMSNHWHVLAETLDRKFERPLRQHLDTYRTIVNERSANYEKALQERSYNIRETELRNSNRRERNLQNFRENLNILQRQVEELDDCKVAHYKEIIEHEEEVWDVVQAKVCLHVRSTMDTFEKFTAKTSDPVIETMLQSVPDPFDSYGPPQSEDQIFTILNPLDIMAPTPSTAPSPLTSSPETERPEYPTVRAAESLPWTPHGLFDRDDDRGSTEWADAHSSPHSATPLQFPSLSPIGTPPRSMSPPGIRSFLGRKSPELPSSSKLKNMLSVIDEKKKNGPNASEASSNDSLIPPPTDSRSDREEVEDAPEARTPRHSTFFSPEPGRDEDVIPVSV